MAISPHGTEEVVVSAFVVEEILHLQGVGQHL